MSESFAETLWPTFCFCPGRRPLVVVSEAFCPVLKKRAAVGILCKNVCSLLNSFYEASIALILNPDKDITKREKHKLVSLINMMKKFPTKY